MQYGGPVEEVEVPIELKRIPATGRDVRGARAFEAGWVWKKNIRQYNYLCGYYK